ncbi:MAG TPA: hypothetical protein VGF40_01355 [Thermoanaerobaculia bacterium]
MVQSRFIEWDRLDVRVLGSRIVAMARDAMRASGAPVEIERIDFRDGDAEVSGVFRKGIAIPFRFHLRRIGASGRVLRLPIEQMSVAGFLPVPALLFRLAEGFARVQGVAIDPETRTVVVSVERFLPEFVDVEIEDVRIVAGGVHVTLGRGGADLPTRGGGFDGHA